MKRIFEAVIKAIGIIITFPAINWFLEIENAAPTCCGKKASFTGSQTSLFQEVFFYQCDNCKRMQVVHNPHNGVSLFRLWRTIYCPKLGKKEVGNER